MTIQEESRLQKIPTTNGIWQRRVFQAPHQAKWVPESFQKLMIVPSLPSMRELRMEADGSWSVEEFVTADHMPLAVYLTKSAAPVWVFVSIVQQCLTGLISLHETGLMHGALTADTVRVDASGNVKLAGCGAGHPVPAPAHGYPAAGTAPALAHALAVADLRDLGRAFRAVLGGDADTKMTVSRPEIAPLVAEWIDWLADPATGREAASATHAEEVFADIRTGRPGWKPWRNKAELPPELSDSSQREPTAEERAKLRRAAARAHGSGIEWRGIIILGLVVLVVLGGGIWALNHFLSAKPVKKIPPEELTLNLPGAGGKGNLVRLPDEILDLFSASGGDVEPLPDTQEVIINLMGVLSGENPAMPEWDAALERQKKDREALTEDKPPGSSFKEDAFLSSPLLFPVMGKPAGAGRVPGDYYLVWRTRGLILTVEETRELQSAILRSARYCGVRLLAWTVLPNHAGAVLRVLPPRPLSDERLGRRIAILRGEKTAASVIAKIHDRMKAGDDEGAKQVRLTWTASMGSAAGFFSVIKTVPVVDPKLLPAAQLWQEKALHLSLLSPDTPEVLQAAAIIDTAALKGQLVESASAWPLCSLSAALHNYGPAIRAISVLMQPNPQASLPLPLKEDLQKSLIAYRRYLGDLPDEPPPVTTPQPGITPLPVTTPPPDAAGEDKVQEEVTKRE